MATPICSLTIQDLIWYDKKTGQRLPCALYNGKPAAICTWACRCRQPEGDKGVCTAFDAGVPCAAANTACPVDAINHASAGSNDAQTPATSAPVTAPAAPLPSLSNSDSSGNTARQRDENQGTPVWQWALIVVGIVVAMGIVFKGIKWYRERRERASDMDWKDTEASPRFTSSDHGGSRPTDQQHESASRNSNVSILAYHDYVTPNYRSSDPAIQSEVVLDLNHTNLGPISPIIERDSYMERDSYSESGRESYSSSEASSYSERSSTLSSADGSFYIGTSATPSLPAIVDLGAPAGCAPPQSPKSDQNPPLSAEEELVRLREELLCSICEDRKKDTVFQCGHETCHQCALRLQTCPNCRQPVQTRIRRYL